MGRRYLSCMPEVVSVDGEIYYKRVAVIDDYFDLAYVGKGAIFRCKGSLAKVEDRLVDILKQMFKKGAYIYDVKMSPMNYDKVLGQLKDIKVIEEE